MKIQEMYDLEHTLAKPYLEQFTYPWQALKGIKDFILALGPTLPKEYKEVSPQVWVHETATVAPTAFLGLHVLLVRIPKFVIVRLFAAVP